HLSIPLLFGCSQPLVEILKAFLEVRCIGRIQLAEFACDSARNPASVVGIEPVVRITQRMNVAHSAGNRAGWNFKNFCKLRSIKVPVCSPLNPRIAALRNEWRQPSNFQMQTN